MNEKTILTLDEGQYLDLLKELKIVPKVIDTEAENERWQTPN
jgi:hypothetical protein